MNASLSLSTVLRRTFGIYGEQALVLLTASIMVDALLALDQVQFKSSAVLAIGALLANLVVFGLFVCAVVLVVADVWDGGPRRGVRELLRGAWSSLGPLLLVGVLAVIAFTFLASIASTIFFVLIATVVLSAGAGALGVIIGLFLVPVLLLVPELFLMTIWSVLAAVAVLERPGGLHAFGRSRELVRGNGWRVLALILVLAFPLALAASALERAAHVAGFGPATAVSLLVATLIAPIPILAATVLYFELLRAEATPASADPTLPIPLPPSTSLP
jgi:hypothetical protein